MGGCSPTRAPASTTVGSMVDLAGAADVLGLGDRGGIAYGFTLPER